MTNMITVQNIMREIGTHPGIMIDERGTVGGEMITGTHSECK